MTEVIRKNLDKAWAKVSAYDINAGMKAYQTYHTTIQGFAEFYRMGFVQSVEAFAYLSPSNDYHGNVRSLAACQWGVLTGRKETDVTITTFKKCRAGAFKFLKGEASFLDTVKGDKITAFRHNILYPYTSKRATIDGHMVCIALGRDLNMKEALFAMREFGYAAFEAEIVMLARRQKLPVPAVQAILWMSRKRANNIRYSEQMIMFGETGTAWDTVLSPLDYPPYELEEWRKWLSRRK